MESLRDRARTALGESMRARDKEATSALRGLLSAFANAEAVPTDVRAGAIEAAVGIGQAEADRRVLGEEDLRELARSEIAEHREAGDDAAARGDDTTARRLHRQADVVAALLP